MAGTCLQNTVVVKYVESHAHIATEIRQGGVDNMNSAMTQMKAQQGPQRAQQSYEVSQASVYDMAGAR